MGDENQEIALSVSFKEEKGEFAPSVSIVLCPGLWLVLLDQMYKLHGKQGPDFPLSLGKFLPVA